MAATVPEGPGSDDRRAWVDRVLGDPPKVHFMNPEDFRLARQTGVWSTERECYAFLADRCSPGSRTLETGSGVSTVLFAAWRTRHTCHTPGEVEAQAIIEYCEARGIPTADLAFEIGLSQTSLPTATADPLDVVLIDGGHGFPTPMIDWFYGGGRLRRGGTLVVDDLQLPAVAVLVAFLDADDRWVKLAGDDKWAAYERRSEGSLAEDWFAQPFYRGPVPYTFSGRVEMALRRRAGRLRTRLALARTTLSAGTGPPPDRARP